MLDGLCVQNEIFGQNISAISIFRIPLEKKETQTKRNPVFLKIQHKVKILVLPVNSQQLTSNTVCVNVLLDKSLKISCALFQLSSSIL